ncbi:MULTISPECIES: hypothetical protein [Kribbella]|uniref:hypothetical protein n=1 Tax=Kribbella TaxID=182639 RepID=UPI0013052485|nr:MULTISPECIES: hypothetical protein [Kribbella]
MISEPGNLNNDLLDRFRTVAGAGDLDEVLAGFGEGLGLLLGKADSDDVGGPGLDVSTDSQSLPLQWQ